jgi:Fe2+ transport system protein FeoA
MRREDMNDMTTSVQSLGDLEIGESAVISGYTDVAPARRLLEMGFLPGTTVKAIRKAPLGDPIEYFVMGGRVSMRRADAAEILVRPEP